MKNFYSLLPCRLQMFTDTSCSEFQSLKSLISSIMPPMSPFKFETLQYDPNQLQLIKIKNAW